MNDEECKRLASSASSFIIHHSGGASLEVAPMKLAGRFHVAGAALAALCVGGALTAAPAPPETPPDKLVVTSMSPDGKKIGLFITNADGSQRTTLTKEGAVE